MKTANSKNNRKPSTAQPLTKSFPKSGTAVAHALDRLLHLDIPAKGRIAHHIRNGRIHRALSLCAQGQAHLWKRVWQRRAIPAILEQLQLLCQLENLLQQERRSATL